MKELQKFNDDIRASFTANANQFDALMVEMLAKNVELVTELEAARKVVEENKKIQRERDELNVSNHELAWKYKVIQEENEEQQAKIDKLNNSIQMRDAMDAGDIVLISENEVLKSKIEQQQQTIDELKAKCNRRREDQIKKQQTIQELAEALNEAADILDGACDDEGTPCYSDDAKGYKALAAQHIKGGE